MIHLAVLNQRCLTRYRFASGVIGPVPVHLKAASEVPMSAEYPRLMTYNAFHLDWFVTDFSSRE